MGGGNGRTCAVRSCKSSAGKIVKWKKSICNIHNMVHDDCICLIPYGLHVFPKDIQSRALWVASLGRKDDYVPSKYSTVCGIHFVDGKPSKEHPHPTLNLGISLNDPRDANDRQIQDLTCSDNCISDLTILENDIISVIDPVSVLEDVKENPNIMDKNIVIDSSQYDLLDVDPDTTAVSTLVTFGLQDLFSQFWNLQTKNNGSTAVWVLSKSFDSNSLFVYSSSVNEAVGCVKIEITDTLQVVVKVYGKIINDDHILKKSEKFPNPITSLNDLMEFLKLVEEFTLCPGNPEAEFKDDNVYSGAGLVNYFTNSVHSMNCVGIVERRMNLKRCKRCSYARKILNYRLIRANKTEYQSMKNVNLKFKSKTQQQQLWNRCQSEHRQMKLKIGRLKSKISELNKNDIHNLFDNILDDDPFCSKDNFQRLLFREQIKILKKKKTRPSKWHPAILKWCSYIKSKSTSAYEAFREVIPLPSQSCLFKCSSILSTKSGFTMESIEKMKQKIDLEAMDEHQKYFNLLVDEMKIKGDLICKANTGEIVGFHHLNKLQAEKRSKTGNSDSDLPIATHVMVLMLKGLTTNFKQILAYFPCHDMKAEDLFSIVQEAIEVLETNGFKVLTVTCDKSVINQKFIKMSTDFDSEKGVGYKTINPYASRNDPRHIYYVSDPHHLIKSVRNCLFHSGSQKNSSLFLKKNGKHILWSHIREMFNKDSSSQQRMCPKLTKNHITLKLLYALQVKLATQVISMTVAKAVEKLVGYEASETVIFLEYFNRFYDMLNTRNLYVGKYNRNSDLEPYTSPSDWRFQWLKKDFLGYLQDWKKEADSYDIPADRKLKMQLSRETLEGIQITVHSVTEAVMFLLNKGAKFVETNKFNHDSLERHFGKDRRFSQNTSLLATKIEFAEKCPPDNMHEAVVGIEYDDITEAIERPTSIKQEPSNCSPVVVIKQEPNDIPTITNTMETNIKYEDITDVIALQALMKEEQSDISTVKLEFNIIKQEPKDIS